MCGPYFRRGHLVLSNLADFLRGLDFDVWLCSELFSVADGDDPDSIRSAAYRFMHAGRGYLLVYLAPETVGEGGDKADLTGGVGYEGGLLDARIEQEEEIHAAYLFDGAKHHQRVSSLLQRRKNRDFIAVMETPGDMEELKELAYNLCVGLEDRLCS